MQLFVSRLSVRELRRGVPQQILLHLCFSLLLLYIFLLLADKKAVLENSVGYYSIRF